MDKNNKYCPVRQLFEEKKIEREANWDKEPKKNYFLGKVFYGADTPTGMTITKDKKVIKTLRKKAKKVRQQYGSMIPPRPANY